MFGDRKILASPCFGGRVERRTVCESERPGVDSEQGSSARGALRCAIWRCALVVARAPPTSQPWSEQVALPSKLQLHPSAPSLRAAGMARCRQRRTQGQACCQENAPADHCALRPARGLRAFRASRAGGRLRAVACSWQVGKRRATRRGTGRLLYWETWWLPQITRADIIATFCLHPATARYHCLPGVRPSTSHTSIAMKFVSNFFFFFARK